MTFGQTRKSPGGATHDPDPRNCAACATPPTRATLTFRRPPRPVVVTPPPADDLEDVVDIDWISVSSACCIASVGGLMVLWVYVFFTGRADNPQPYTRPFLHLPRPSFQQTLPFG